MMEEPELCFPKLLNISCRRPKRPHFEIMLTYILLSFISLLTVILNLLVIISISHFRQLHTPTNFLLLSLAVADFFVGLLMFFQIVLIDGCWFLGDIMCTLYQYLAFIITSASVGTMVIISADRYLAICYPLHYSTQITQQRVNICISLCWLFSVIFQSLIVKDNLKQPGKYNSCIGECVFVVNYIAGLFDLLFSFIVPITVIVVLYLRVFVVAVSQARAMRCQLAVTHQRSVTVTVTKSELKAARTLGVVVVVFLICMCPYYCVALTGQDNFLNASSAAFVICLVYFNSCLNPIIYVFFYSWFRKSIKLIATLQILQPDSQLDPKNWPSTEEGGGHTEVCRQPGHLGRLMKAPEYEFVARIAQDQAEEENCHKTAARGRGNQSGRSSNMAAMRPAVDLALQMIQDGWDEEPIGGTD
ncbi:trace amine-associated receptor 8a-like [Simochromis diagramma]|uniref:trace amine-associated receptor 8a-like n=1 Tax=Simochromis diagramma TaxID=43689 RepID=UPI001A7E8B14|nr:trace amine-associated receptor 8a-like [Simochromis diagramma]